MLCPKPSNRVLFALFAALALFAFGTSTQAGTKAFTDADSWFDKSPSARFDFTLPSTTRIALSQPGEQMSMHQESRSIAGPAAVTATRTWQGGSGSNANDWFRSQNWSGGVPGSGDTAQFDNTANGSNLAPSISSTNTSVGAILFAIGTTNAYNISGSATLTVGSATVAGITNASATNQQFTVATIALGIGQTWDVQSTGNLSFSSAVSLGSNTLTLSGSTSGTGTISGVISGSGGLTKSGTGTWTLSGSGANTYNGVTTVNGGILDLAKTGAVAVAGNMTIGDGATTAGLDIVRLATAGSGGNQIADTSILTFNGTGTNAGTLRMNDKSETVGGIASSAGAGVIENSGTGSSTLTVNVSGTDRTFSGIIQNGGTGSLALVKTGSAAQTLTGASTYTGGTTVSGGGKLLVNNTSGSGTGTGAVTVNGSGTILGGNGTISGAVTVGSGARLAPGATGAAGSTAILNTGALTLSSGSFFNVDLNSTTVGTGYDQVSVTGTVNITGSNLALNIGGSLSVGQKFFIVSNDLSDAITGSGAWGTTVSSGAYTFSINYADTFSGSANDISLTVTAVPEPSTWIGGALALVAIGYTQRKRLLPGKKLKS